MFAQQLITGWLAIDTMPISRQFQSMIPVKTNTDGYRCGAAFGGNAARVALVFRIPYEMEGSLNLNLLFSPVAYLNREQTHEIFREVIRNLKDNTEFLKSIERQTILNLAFYTILVGSVCAKHEGFREEREWRAIYIPSIFSSPLMASSVETVLGVPQIVFHIPLDASYNPAAAEMDLSKILERVIIGPTQYPLAMQVAIQTELVNSKCLNTAVLMSTIPLRT